MEDYLRPEEVQNNGLSLRTSLLLFFPGVLLIHNLTYYLLVNR